MSGARRWLHARTSSVAFVLAPLLMGCGPEDPASPVTEAARWAGARLLFDRPAVRGSCPPLLEVALDGNRDGVAVAAWQSDCEIWTSRFDPAGGWDVPRAVGGLLERGAENWLWGPRVAVGPGGHALAVWIAQDGDFHRPLLARSFTPSTGWGPVREIDGGNRPEHLEFFPPQVGLDAAGAGFVVWNSRRLWAVRSTAGGAWEPPVDISDQEQLSVRMSVAPDGRATVAWADAERIETVAFDPARGWDAASRLVPVAGAPFSDVELDSDEGGRILMGFRRSGRPGTVGAAASDGRTWRELEMASLPGVAAGNVRVGLGENGRGLLLWQEGESAAFADVDLLAGASLRREARPLAPFAPKGEWSLAVGRRGTAFVAGLVGSSPSVSRYDGSSWTVPEPLAPLGEAPRIAADRCGNATAVWVSAGVWTNRFPPGCS
jgi:hypothetical protein